MPVYHFTFHAYLSWLPDRPEGYVHHTTGLNPTNPDLAKLYRGQAREEPVEFSTPHQLILVEETLTAARFQNFEPLAIGTDATHLHVLLQWRDERVWSKLRNGLKESYSRKLNAVYGKREWFCENASRKRVVNREHYQYLRTRYIPDHPGAKWDAARGVVR